MADFPGRPAVTGVSKSQSKCKCQVLVTSEESYKVRIDLLSHNFNIKKKYYFKFLNNFIGYSSCFFNMSNQLNRVKSTFIPINFKSKLDKKSG
jgi:hypothetical protein